jgi:hypothetical protein
MSNVCGYYCLAFLHYINAYQDRTKDLYIDTDNFLNLFEDLNKSIDFKKNEYVLKHFFLSNDPKLRTAIQVFDQDIAHQEHIISHDKANGGS